MLTLSTLGRMAVPILLPPNSLMLCALAGLLLLSRKPRLARVLLWGSFALTLALSTGLSYKLLMRALGPVEPLDLAAARQAQAVVILASEAKPAPEFGGPTVGDFTLVRLRYGAAVARQTGLPILVSGGSLGAGLPTMAELMQRSLTQDFRLPARWLEDRSLTTHQNALMSARILLPQGVRKIVLVTQEYHMKRATREFEAAGFQVVPAPTGLNSKQHMLWHEIVRPNMKSLLNTQLAIHELLGLLVADLDNN